MRRNKDELCVALLTSLSQQENNIWVQLYDEQQLVNESQERATCSKKNHESERRKLLTLSSQRSNKS